MIIGNTKVLNFGECVVFDENAKILNKYVDGVVSCRQMIDLHCLTQRSIEIDGKDYLVDFAAKSFPDNHWIGYCYAYPSGMEVKGKLETAVYENLDRLIDVELQRSLADRIFSS